MPTLDPETLMSFARNIFMAKGVPEETARVVARSLVDGNLRGHDSHGVIRIIEYVDWQDRGWIRPDMEMEIVSDRGHILIVDGHFQYGQIIGRQATKLAIERAREHGVCILTIRRASHLGRIGEFMEQAAEAGIVCFSLTNTHGGGVLQTPHGGRQPRLSANPVAGGAPVPGGEDIIMDMATSATAEGKVKVARARGEKLPEGYLVDGQCQPTTEPEDYYADPPGAILPVAGHKGYALAVFADIFAGAISGGSCSREGVTQIANGWFAVFVDPAAFCGQDVYDDQVGNLVRWVKSSATREGFDEVLMPGEPEARTLAERSRTGIPIETDTWAKIVSIAEDLGVAVPSVR